MNLDEFTQATWIKCGGSFDFHFSLLALSVTNESLYQHKKQLIKENFGDQRLPNIVMFVMDSISRSGFHRGCPDTMNLLSELKVDRYQQSKSEIFEFHRYSTVSWGTGQNCHALSYGNCASFVEGCPKQQHNMTLFEYYDAMGYNVFGSTKEDRAGCCWHMGVTDNKIVPGVQFIKQALKQQSADDGVPYFIIIHESSNHGANNQGIYASDEVIHDLVESINYDTTMLNLLADHGNLIGNGLQTFHGGWEMNNPPNILLMPKWFANDINVSALQINQQRFFSHYDNHRFYKEILWKLFTKKDDLSLYDSMIEQTLPVIGNLSLSVDILNDVIPLDRKCDGILPGWCVCHTLQLKELTDELVQNDQKYLQQIIDAINNVTGDGKWDCQKLNAADFAVTKHFEDEIEGRGSMKLSIQQIVENEDEKQALLKENRLLTYSADFSYESKDKAVEFKLRKEKKKGFAIERIDWFKFEECTTNDVDKAAKEVTPGTFFADEKVQKQLEQSGKVSNLRLCKCKKV